ncbi:MAG: hypothetical protein NPIRA06_22150 [Nitrospirales bacterium]|nr:MAG: hypothetical protein NPIRA06_22150 [Nitrospirales bacterium]
MDTKLGHVQNFSMLQLRTILLSLTLLGLTLFGCEMYYKMEGVATLAGVEKDLDMWLGKSKDEQIQKMGDPVMCMLWDEHGEFCHWMDPGDSTNSSFRPKRIFYYDNNSVVCGWTYTGQWADQSKNLCKR